MVIAVIAASSFVYYCYRYPYGWSHCCDKVLSFALLQYAEDHDGWLAMQATAELA